MPGIFGLTTQNAKKINIKLIAMQKAMKLYPHFLADALYTSEHLAASRVHLGKIGEKSSPIQRANLYVWVEGEAYNLSEVAKEVGLRSTTLGNLLLEAEEQGKLNQALNKLDGYFCAALYNQTSNKVKGFLVRKNTPGFTTEKMEDKMALRTVQNAIITLKDCRITEKDRLQNANSFRDTAKVLRMTRAGVAWQAVGCARGAYENALKYTKKREQFGKPIASFQLVQNHLVEMAV